MTHRSASMKRNLKKYWKMASLLFKAEQSTLGAVLFGCFVYSLGVMSFTVPFRFPDSGVTGIAVLLNYSLGAPVPLFVGISNVVLLAWAWRQLSLRVVLWTVFSVGLITVLMQAMEALPPIPTDQKLLVALIGGAIKGVGGGVVFRSGVTMGGLDIVILYLQKKYGIEVGKYNFYINMCILGVGAFVVGIENAMFGLVGIYTSSMMIDNAIATYDKRRLVFVVTNDPCPVVEYMTKVLIRGATIIDAHGGYSGQERPMVMCLLTRRQAVDLKRFLANNHPKAFMVVTDAAEVIGRGFKPWH